MKILTLSRGIALALVLVAAASAPIAAHAQVKSEEKPAPGSAAATQDPMQLMMQYAQPGEHHKMLEPFAGSFTATVKSWMAPGQPPMESTGTSVNSWVLGGRFLKQEFEGSFGGMPFTGLGYTGYDNVKKKFIGLWMDTMGTSVMVSEGVSDASGRVITSTSNMDDPMSGQSQALRTVTTVSDNDHMIYEMFMKGPDGADMKVMEIDYARKK
jgi:hypothetical protein